MTNVANADPITFSGGDAGANSTDPRPNSNATAATFDAAAGALGATSLINFESAPLGSLHNNVVIAPGVTLSGTGSAPTFSDQTIRNSPAGTPDRLFGYNTTAGGSQFASLSGGFLEFEFATPIDAFGAYLSGVQMDGGEIVIFASSEIPHIPIPKFGGNDVGGVQFLGFTDAGQQIRALTIFTPGLGLGVDIVGLDDVRFTAVPGPIAGAGLPGLILASGGLLAWWRRRQRPSRCVGSRLTPVGPLLHADAHVATSRSRDHGRGNGLWLHVGCTFANPVWEIIMKSFTRIALGGAALLTASVALPSVSHAVTFFMTSDHCTGRCEGAPPPRLAA
jgi:hypothetical protein